MPGNYEIYYACMTFSDNYLNHPNGSQHQAIPQLLVHGLLRELEKATLQFISVATETFALGNVRIYGEVMACMDGIDPSMN